ncbi:phosphoglycolate phosphatase [Clostridium acetobutylicum]|uniref:Predicted phosphatase of HAD hydrolase superfamily n=1 Tax=Clostridium acetobutylicum (strain ATCC 824 / DSM 792 / JCM 1419 / IAM 19013 / LMG 5710 / NBRC 13948 / NRRL B-527 / VKM B-1787 / 2291 / W) TaxID=272562 RepID=Q97G73_CLOAB|nr:MULTISPECIES: HAD family hydrolase [Clostridium]AAK80450.1 Predicted phosphatase of HAD hydrolase superfamily [Clostridium acetobutylicum ATCC 824]ADZ21547.1 phosphatase of HAD hydrolase superfamily [Clostridium acetobutylicum EA 2018]AEI32388.1 HAD family phosphatase [Clostridium acetobutylicum DSM 1731]AWV79133.1 HAD family hydrolase [Clostridium acetobutylicum]MBC2394904.1 HAD family hydrolase [Clostridium acetobutylicum]
MKIDSIIFDLDGTLWNSIEGVCEAWKVVLKRHSNINKIITPKDIKASMGLQIDEIGKLLFPEEDEKMQLQLMNECCDEEKLYLGEHGGKLFAKLEPTLNKLSQKYKLFIVSNCEDGYIQSFFKAHGLNKYFTDFECSGVTGLSKGENNKLIIKRNSLKNPVYVGDTLKDFESAKIANIPFVYARYGFGDVNEYDYVIDSFEEMLTLDL